MRDSIINRPLLNLIKVSTSVMCIEIWPWVIISRARNFMESNQSNISLTHEILAKHLYTVIYYFNQYLSLMISKFEKRTQMHAQLLRSFAKVTTKGLIVFFERCLA